MPLGVEAFRFLRELARGATNSALPLPSQQEAAEIWRGLAFTIGANRLISALGEVVEVIAVPTLTTVPGAAPWVSGVANLRGRLLPVVELCGYLGLERTTPAGDWRVLVIEDGDLFCGLMVEQSFGMLQFEVDDYDGSAGEPLGNRLDTFLRGSFRQGPRSWRVVDMRALVRDPAFFEVAA